MGYKTTLCDVSLDGGHYGIAAPAVDFKPGLPAYLRITDINDDGTLNPSDRKSVDDSSAGNYLLHEATSYSHERETVPVGITITIRGMENTHMPDSLSSSVLIQGR